MTETGTVAATATSVARGVAREKGHRVKEQLEPRADLFKAEAAEKVESLADQIRQLGSRFERQDEAHALARRLERSADYLRFRPATQVAQDAWQTAIQSRVLWIAGGVVAGAILYTVLRRR
jgi:hypothetical protein